MLGAADYLIDLRFHSSYSFIHGNGRHRYKSRLVKWLALENEKKTAISQDWRHKKENLHNKVLDGKLSEDAGLE